MSNRRADFISTSLLAMCAALLISCVALRAQAAWGGDAASIQDDQFKMQGSRRMIAVNSYTVHEIQADTGTVVREYVSADGKVFAVAWQGPWLPDMRQILGGYFEQYRVALQSQNSGHIARRPVMIDQPGLVVQIGGHMRAFAGRADLPDTLPSGLHVEDIQ